MLRLVLDTNILVSSLLRKQTPPYQLYRAWREGLFELLTSQPQIEELQRVLHYPRLQRYLTPEEAQEMLAGVVTYAVLVSPLPSVSYSPDPDDNLILATAIAGHADYLISGDKSHVLALEKIEGIPILSARQAIERLNLDE